VTVFSVFTCTRVYIHIRWAFSLAILQSVYPFVQCKIICIITVADCPLACCVVHCRSLSAGVDINSEDGIRV